VNQKVPPEDHEVIRAAYLAGKADALFRERFCAEWAEKYGCKPENIRRILIGERKRLQARKGAAQSLVNQSIWDMPRPVLDWERK